MASNKEIVKAVLRETTLFNGAASVSEYSNECNVKIVTKSVFIRMSDLASLKLFIEQKGGRVKDIEISPMPARDNRLSVVVVFEK
jgi:hypothetical protein